MLAVVYCVSPFFRNRGAAAGGITYSRSLDVTREIMRWAILRFTLQTLVCWSQKGKVETIIEVHNGYEMTLSLKMIWIYYCQNCLPNLNLKQARKPRSYASSKLRPTNLPTDWWGWVKCRAIYRAKKYVPHQKNGVRLDSNLYSKLEHLYLTDRYR